MKIVIPGGSGQLGVVLSRAFQREGHEVVVLSRQPKAAPWRVVAWDSRTIGDWSHEIDGSDVVINLAGRSVNCRYNARNRREILGSRGDSTNVVGQAIAQATSPPKVWLQAATATIYAHRFDTPNDEAAGIIGGSEPDLPETWRFSIEVATAWERAVEESQVPETRKVILRSAMVMGLEPGGVFNVLLGLVRKGLGGQAGDGKQYVSWIHENDFIEAIRWLIDRDDITGAVNLASPGPLPNGEFMRELRQAWGTKVGLPATRWMLEVGAIFPKTETELILKSRRVIPGRLLQEGFQFQFPEWKEAARDLCDRWRKG
jgi:uncharacterized protein